MEDNIDYKFNEIAAKTIKKYREKKNLSLEEVVKKMKNPISRQSLFKYENNLARMKNSTFNDICSALNIEPTEVYDEINRNLIYSSGRLSKEINQPIDIPLMDNSGKITYGKIFGKEGMLETIDDFIIIDDEQNKPFNKLDILYSKTKDILSDDDRATLEFIMQKTIDNYEKSKNNNIE